MAKQLAKTDLADVLALADGSYVEAYHKLVAKIDEEAVASSKRSTVADRKARWAKALSTMDRGVLAKINKTMSGYLKLVRAQPVAFSEEPRAVTEEEAESLAGEFIALRDIEEFLKVRRGWIKDVVFAHLTEVFAEEGEEFPEHVPGRLVTSLGDFAREAVGRMDPDLDEDVLAELLGDDWEDICDEEVVVTRKLNIEKLMKKAESNPAILEDVRSALKPGKFKSGRMVFRPTQTTHEE